MKFNKIIPLSLATLMTAGGLTGCNVNKNVGKELIVWATAEEEQVLKEAVKIYNASKESDDEKIYLTYSDVEEGKTGSELAKNPQAETAADLILTADDHVADLASNGTIANLTSVVDSDFTTQHVDNAIKGVTYNKKIYGMPISNDNGYFLYYNSDVITDNNAKTLEGLFSAAKTAKKIVNIDFGTGYYDVMPFIGAGGKLSWSTKASGVKYEINWDDDALAARAKKISDLIVAQGDYFSTGDDAFAVNGFQNGTVCATVRGTWLYDQLKEAMGDNANKLKAVKLPTFDGKQLGSFTGSKLYAVNGLKPGDDGAERRTRAIEFAKILTGKEVELIRFEKRNTIPSRKDAQADSRFKDHTNMTIDALNAQNAAASIIQSQSAQTKYWPVGTVIGNAIISGDYGKDYSSWKEFLEAECDILR